MAFSVTLKNLAGYAGATNLQLFLRNTSDNSLLNAGGDTGSDPSSIGSFTWTVAEDRPAEQMLARIYEGTTETAANIVIDSVLNVGFTEIGTEAAALDSAITNQLDGIEDSIAAYIAGIAASASLTPGTIVGFPETLNIGDSYTDDCDSAIHVFIRDDNDDPITAVGTHDFTDGDFAPECIITLNGNTGRVKCEVEYVTASPENYLKIQIPSKESRRATPGVSTVQVLLKWDGAQKALSKQTVTWDGLI